MIMYHATTRTALSSIKTEGLCVRYADSRKALRSIWFHTRSNSAWALLHTQKRHGASLDDLVVIEVSVPRTWLRRFQGGLWYTNRDVPVERLGRIIEGTNYAASAK
jgi:hypothetical protein